MNGRSWIWVVSLLLLVATALGQSRPAALDQPQEAAAAAAAAHDEGPHLGERVNEWIDNAAATGDRLLQLPLFMVALGLAVPALAAGLLIARFNRKRPRLVRWLVGIEAATLVLFLAILADRRIASLQDEVRALRQQAANAAIAGHGNAHAPPATQVAPRIPEVAVDKTVLPTMAAATETLKPLFQGIRLEAQPADSAVSFIRVSGETPLIKAFVAIADLTRGQVKINADLKTKTLTSTFAKSSDALVAINGEAGTTPQMGAPLGTWSGHLVRDGEVLLVEQAGNPRPFLSFDRDSKPRFISAASKDRHVPSDAFNVIWGRWDVLVDSNLIASDFTRQPRTAMAINKERTRLFLFVGDGRQPRHSIGFTRAEVGNILRALGASDGMLCDEGGSSTMYLQAANAVVNSPSDGRERPVYTHFGIIGD